MKQNIDLWQLIGFATTSLLGSLLHFAYDLTGLLLLAPFSAVNESTWEHMKLLFFPMLLFALVQRAFPGKAYAGFWSIKLRGTLLGLTLIPILFFTLRGIFGTTPDAVNILIFFLAAGLAYLYETRLFAKAPTPRLPESISLLALGLLTLAFVLFTFYPPAIPLFADPIDGRFGI